MKIVKNILLGLGGLIVLLVLVSFLLPRHRMVSRSRDIAAPPQAIQAQITELHNWQAWSPWHKLDPDMKITYSSPSAGPGAWYAWTSDHSNVGSGKLELISISQDSIYQSMDFGMGLPAYATFRFAPGSEGKTHVTWLLYTDQGNNPIGRWMGLMMDSFVGKDYEEGLANLARQTEK